MVIREYRLPQGPRELTCDPPLGEWAAAVEKNRESARGWRFSILGLPAAEMIRRVRARLWGEAPDRPVILTGHQPVLFHAGIWIKAWAVRCVADAMGALGANINVDSDEERALGVWLPARAAGQGQPVSLVRRRVEWDGSGAGARLPLEKRPAPSRAQWEAFVEEGREALATLGPGEPGAALLARWDAFAEAGRRALNDAGGGSSLASFLARCRQELEAEHGGPRLRERFVSEVAATPEFRRLVLAWAAEAPRLADWYNEQLRAYRRARRIRSRANPFPDLRRYGEQVEMPFWLVGAGGERIDLFAVRRGEASLELFTRYGRVIGLDLSEPERAVASLEEATVEIRPKAVTLTLFLRLFACDLFVHGIGGGRYDHITDGVIRAWLGVEPPRYAVISANVPLDLPRGEGGEPGAGAGAVRFWKQQLRALRYNPQRFVNDPAGDQAADCSRVRELALEKQRLIEAIGQPGAPKRALTRRIEAVNAELYGLLEPVRARFEAQLQAARGQEQEESVIWARDYPFFLHASRDMKALLEAGGIRCSGGARVQS